MSAKFKLYRRLIETEIGKFFIFSVITSSHQCITSYIRFQFGSGSLSFLNKDFDTGSDYFKVKIFVLSVFSVRFPFVFYCN